MSFDLEKYLNNSRKVDIKDIDFTSAREHPLTDSEIRCLTYMMDIEAHTIIYLRGLLRTCAIRDPEITAFLGCWLYEEFFHGRALRKFLDAVGVQFPPTRIHEVRRRRSWRERLEEVGASVLCRTARDFHAVYLAWGAVQELSTLEGYGVLARRTQNPVLAELLRRIIKDERRHFSFYFNKAQVYLQSRSAQLLTRAILRHFWTPVGDGVKDDADVQWVTQFVFGDAEGAKVAGRIDAGIARLPGQEWFNLMSALRTA
jgi:hypothetical protein